MDQRDSWDQEASQWAWTHDSAQCHVERKDIQIYGNKSITSSVFVSPPPLPPSKGKQGEPGPSGKAGLPGTPVSYLSLLHHTPADKKKSHFAKKKKKSTSANSYAITKSTLNDASCICHDIHLSFGCTSECWKLLVGKWVWRNISELFALKGEVKSKMAFKNVRPH